MLKELKWKRVRKCWLSIDVQLKNKSWNTALHHVHFFHTPGPANGINWLWERRQIPTKTSPRYWTLKNGYSGKFFLMYNLPQRLKVF